MGAMDQIDALVVGAGVVGLATARALALAGLEVVIAERETAFGTGVSSRNSEVIHAGHYYDPGSLKARLCVRGRRLMVDYCRSRGVEHRICGADANPYVAAAAVLAGVEHGIRLQLDPGPPVTGNGYRETGAVAALPRSWPEAIERAAGSVFLAEALGADFLRIFLAIKRQECARWAAEVTELDRAWYLGTV